MIVSPEKVQAFLYLLMRDDLPAGRVFTLMDEVKDTGGGSMYSNNHLAEYAKQLIIRFFLEAKPECDCIGKRFGGHSKTCPNREAEPFA